MTSASTHDSQVAIPLGTLTAGRVENLYDLMDAAYDSIEIWAHSILLGHKPIVDVNPRRSVDMQKAWLNLLIVCVTSLRRQRGRRDHWRRG